MIHIPYLAHIPFVIVFLGFALCFVVTQTVSRRR
jgi:uncharacterized membrane protein